MARRTFLDRLTGLTARRGTRRFAAVASPHGVHVVEYGRQRGGLVLRAGIGGGAVASEPDALAHALADAVDALGGRPGGGGPGGGPGRELAVALSGFGTAHHILTLPPAEDEILRPVVRRELLRYYPDLADPVIDFAFGAEAEGAGAAGGGGGGGRELLVGAAPRGLGVGLSRALRERGIVLHHLTVLPRVLQAIYDTFDGDDASAVMVLVLESGTLIGCFHRAALRLFIEPPQDMHGRPLRDPASVAEQVERANLFLRQQFPGAAVGRVLLAAPDGEADAVRAALEEAGSDVTPLADAPGGSLAALGTALAAEQPDSLALLPREVQPRTPAQRLTRRLAVAAAALVMSGAVWWAVAGMLVARAQAERAGTVEAEVSTVLPALTQTERILEARRAHELRLRFLAETTVGRTELRRVMAGVASAAGPAISLETLTVARADDGWAVELAGVAESGSAAAAVRAIDALYQGVPDRLPVVEAAFGGMAAREPEDGVRPPGPPVAISFDMSFIVQWQTDLAR